MYLAVAVRSLFGCFPNGGIHGVILKILHPDSSASTGSFNLTETEKRGKSFGQPLLRGEGTDVKSGNTVQDR